MKPPLFDYHDPLQLNEALALLDSYGEDAKLLAGGQSLGPMLNMRLLYPRVIIDINRIPDLGDYDLSANGMRIGGTTRQADLEDDERMPVLQPLLAAALPYIAHRAIRNRGTVGGSLSHADPAAEWGALALALDAEFVMRRNGDEVRSLPASDFYKGFLSTALRPDEILTEVRIPAWPARRGWSFREISRRHGDFAIAGVAAWLELDTRGLCVRAAVALIGAADRPFRAHAAERLLLGETPRPRLFAEAGAVAAREFDPLDDLHASADYRRKLVEVLVQDALTEATPATGNQ